MTICCGFIGMITVAIKLGEYVQYKMTICILAFREWILIILGPRIIRMIWFFILRANNLYHVSLRLSKVKKTTKMSIIPTDFVPFWGTLKMKNILKCYSSDCTPIIKLPIKLCTPFPKFTEMFWAISKVGRKKCQRYQ